MGAPKEYCLDRRSGRRSGVVFASCVRLRGHDTFDRTYGHLLTVAVAGAKSDLPDARSVFAQGCGQRVA